MYIEYNILLEYKQGSSSPWTLFWVPALSPGTNKTTIKMENTSEHEQSAYSLQVTIFESHPVRIGGHNSRPGFLHLSYNFKIKSLHVLEDPSDVKACTDWKHSLILIGEQNCQDRRWGKCIPHIPWSMVLFGLHWVVLLSNSCAEGSCPSNIQYYHICMTGHNMWP